MVADTSTLTSYDGNHFLYGLYEDRINDTTEWRDYGSVTTFFRGCLVLLLRAGFLLIQIGCIPITDVHMIILQNIIDITCGTLAYGIIGYMFSFGYDAAGIIGAGSWLVSAEADIDNAVLGWAAVVIASAIFTTMVAGRLHCVAYISVTVLLGGVLQPIFMHWVWAESGWMHRSTFTDHKVSYKDHGGGCIIHVCAGLMAFIGAIFLGRRLLRLRDIDESSLPPESPGTAVVGYVMIIIGLTAICLPTPTYEMTHKPENYIGIILINNLLAAAGGIMTVLLLQYILSHHMLNYWIILRCMQGAVAGIVTISSGVDVYKPLVAFAVSLPGGIIFYFLAQYIFISSLEDYANIIPIHLVCGLFGTLLPPLVGSSEGFGVWQTVVVHLGWQILCNMVFLVVIIGVIVLLFQLLKCLRFLRNHSEEIHHRRAVTTLRRSGRRYFFQRLLAFESDPQYLQPGYRTKNESNSIPEMPSKTAQNLSSYTQTPSIRQSSIKGSKQGIPLKQSIKKRLPTEMVLQEIHLNLIPQLRDKANSYENISCNTKNIISEIQEIRVLKLKKMKRHIYTLRNVVGSTMNTDDGIHIEGEVTENKIWQRNESGEDSESTDDEMNSHMTKAYIHIDQCRRHDSRITFTDKHPKVTLSCSALPRLLLPRELQNSQLNKEGNRTNLEIELNKTSHSESNIFSLTHGLPCSKVRHSNQKSYLGKSRRVRLHNKISCGPYRIHKMPLEVGKETSPFSSLNLYMKQTKYEKVNPLTSTECTYTEEVLPP